VTSDYRSQPALLLVIPSEVEDSLAVRFLCLSVVILFLVTTSIRAGDAVAIGYNTERIWTAVTYYSSSTPKGGRDYKTEKKAREEALRDLRARAGKNLATASILTSSDSTGFAAVARGKNKSGRDVNVVGYGKSQREADEKALAQLNQAEAGANQKIVYRYFSHGADSK
jgi:hypothetical protein